MASLTALIFDLDGTLLDSAPDLRRALNVTLAGYGRAPLDMTQVASLTGDGLMPLLQRGFAASGAPMTEAEIAPVFEAFIANYRKLDADPGQIYPEVVALLEQCQSHGIIMGVCTNKQEAETNRLLQQIDLQKFFGFVAGGDTYPVHKPHPDHVRGVMTGLQVSVAHCVMIGDSRNDIAAAHAAGIPCIGVTHGYGSRLEKLGADITVDRFSEIPAALTELGFTHPLS